MCPDPTTGDGGATEGDIRGSFSDIIDVVGVKDLAGGHCAVTENSPAALSVLVAPGIVYIPNADYDELDSNQVKFWEAIVTVSTAVTITANTSGSARVDLVCAKMDTAVTPDEHASNIVTLVAVAGTPGAGAPATPDNHYVLATVAVANGASTIVNADITDSRVQAKINSDYIGASVSVTTKGDLQTHDGSTPARLAVGTDGQGIIANSSATNGIQWADITNNSLSRQAIINGNFDVWQRGTSITLSSLSAQTTADRWSSYADHADYSVSREDGTGVTGSQYCLKVQRANGSTQVTPFNVYYCGLEKTDSVKFRGKKLTLSFWAKKGADFSPTTFTGAIYTGTTGDQYVWNMTGGASVGSVSPTLTTDWQKFTITTTNVIASNVNEITLRFHTSACVGTAGGNDAFYITQVQLCAGDVALPFMPKSYEEELRACLRYYYRTAQGAAYAMFGNGTAISTTAAEVFFHLPVIMRTIPTLETSGTASDYRFTDGVDTVVCSALPEIDTLTDNKDLLMIKGTVASGLTQYRFYRLGANNTTNAYLAFSAEL